MIHTALRELSQIFWLETGTILFKKIHIIFSCAVLEIFVKFRGIQLVWEAKL